MIAALIRSLEHNFALFEFWPFARVFGKLNAYWVIILDLAMHFAGLAMDTAIFVQLHSIYAHVCPLNFTQADKMFLHGNASSALVPLFQAARHEFIVSHALAKCS